MTNRPTDRPSSMIKGKEDHVIELYRFGPFKCSPLEDDQNSAPESVGASGAEITGTPQDSNGHVNHESNGVPSIGGEEESFDMVKYGPPEALTRFDQQWMDPMMVRLVNSSIEDIRLQIAREVDLRLQRERKKYSHVEDVGEELVKQRRMTDATPSSLEDATDSTNSEPFYTPSEGDSLFSCAHENTITRATAKESQTKEVTIEATAVPRSNSLPSTTLQPRRRDLLKVVLRRLGGLDSRRPIYNRLTGDLKSSYTHTRKNFKKAKKMMEFFSMDKRSVDAVLYFPLLILPSCKIRLK